MSYATHADIVASNALRPRLAACAAQEGITEDPVRWVALNVWWMPKADWIAAWEYMEAQNPNEDHGANEAGITDAMILAVVQPMVTGG